MNTNSINNAQNSYALYSTVAPAATQSSTTTSTQSTTSSADTVTISPEALALQQAADDAQNVVEPPIYTPNHGGGYGVRPPQ